MAGASFPRSGNRTERISLVNPDPAAPSTFATVDQAWAFDAAGNVRSASPDGTSAHAVAYIYDDDTNPNSSAYPHGTTVAGRGTGKLLTIALPSGRSTTYSYRSSGAVATVWSDQGATETTTRPGTTSWVTG